MTTELCWPMANYVLPQPTVPLLPGLQSQHRRAYDIRQFGPDDTGLVAEFLSRLSRRTLQLRYLTPRPPMEGDTAWQEALRLSQGDPAPLVAIVATAREQGREQIIGLAELVPDKKNPCMAEVGITVRDDYQCEGIGSSLMKELVSLAQQYGLQTLRFDILAENTAVRRMVTRLKLPHTSQTQYGETVILASLKN